MASAPVSVARSRPLNSVRPSVGVEQAGDHAPERRLAAARLADQPDHLALADGQGHIVDGVHHLRAVAPSPATPTRARRGRAALTKRFVSPTASMMGAARRCHHACPSRCGRQQRTSRPATGCGDRRLDAALLDGSRAARAKAAARRQVDQRGRHAGDLGQPRAARVGRRHRAEQALGIGVQRRADHVARPTLLDDGAGIHHRHAVGQRADDRQVMADPDHGRAGLAAQLLRLVQDLRLDRDVERRGRLVGDDQLGLVEEGDGDRHALAHAAGQLVRIGLEPPLRARRCRPGPARRAASVARLGAADASGAPAPPRSSAYRPAAPG